MTHMHRWDLISLEWLTHPRLNRCMTRILGREPYAVQSMLYGPTEVELGASEGGGPCGVWVDRDGNPEVEMRPVGAWQPHMQGIGEASS